jgi:hypothetical protein
MKDLIKKILKEEFEDFDWIKDQNPQPWEEFMFQFTNLTPKLENTRFGEIMIYRDENNEWIFFHKQNSKSGSVWFNYDKIWLVFGNRFGFKHSETQELLTGWLGEHYNLRGVTAFTDSNIVEISWESITI